MTKLVPPETIAAFRRFNRFYTKKIGVLSESLLDSPFSLIEARILFELASRSEAGEAIFASVLRAELGLDQLPPPVRRFDLGHTKCVE